MIRDPLREEAFSCSQSCPDPESRLTIQEKWVPRRILGEYIEPGPRDATRTVERLLAVLDRNDVVHALDRIKRRRVIRLVE